MKNGFLKGFPTRITQVKKIDFKGLTKALCFLNEISSEQFTQFTLLSRFIHERFLYTRLELNENVHEKC